MSGNRIAERVKAMRSFQVGPGVSAGDLCHSYICSVVKSKDLYVTFQRFSNLSCYCCKEHQRISTIVVSANRGRASSFRSRLIESQARIASEVV